MRKPIPHYEHVDLAQIHAQFFRGAEDGSLHRATLRIPFKNRAGERRALCVLGQNPSNADESVADKTIHYIEKLIYTKHPEYTELLILNLFSCVDTAKTSSNPTNSACNSILETEITHNTDFLLVFGKLKNQRYYAFLDKAKSLAPLFEGKTVFKLDIGATYAPHPGNRDILYHNFNIDISAFDFSAVLTT